MVPSEIADLFELSTEDNCVRFLGEKLECYIPERYQSFGFLELGATVKTLGIFKMVVNDEYECGLQLPTTIEMYPTDIYQESISPDDNEAKKDKFYVCSFDKGGQVVTNLNLVQNDKVGYTCWREFMSVGHMPLYIDYDNVAFLFDDLKECTGKGISADHAVLEIIYSHLFRDANDANIPYRNTNMARAPQRITLTDISNGLTGTFAKIAGSYAQQGYNAALLNQSDENVELEDLFRR